MLERGDYRPKILTPPPGPRSLDLSRRIAAAEAPGINTLYGGEPNVFWHEARGANVVDVDGNIYVDLTSGFGVAAVGHRHPRVVEAVRRQSETLLHGLGDAAGHAVRVELAERLLALAPWPRARVYFAVSGADAVEVALKTALLATGRPGVVAFDPAYHGLTLGALTATSREAFRAPFAEHLHRRIERLPFGVDSERLDALLEAGEVGAVVVEPIVGREGVLLPPAGWLAEVAEICRRRGALFIADEIFTGFGRTGGLFAVDVEDVRPDLLCCGKALAGGMPIAAVLGRRELLDAWNAPGEARHTATFVAHPPACAAALAVLDVLADEELPRRAREHGDEIAPRLEAWRRFPAVRDIRGRGLLWGLELADRELAGSFVHEARLRGVLTLAGGPDGRVAQIVPPLNISSGLLATALDVLESLLDE